MDDSQVTVTISGTDQTGKCAVAEVLRAALLLYEARVDVEGDDECEDSDLRFVEAAQCSFMQGRRRETVLGNRRVRVNVITPQSVP